MGEDVKLPEGWKRVRLGEKEFFKIVGSGIEYFQGYKNYLSTNSVQYSQITHIEEIISYRNRPSRANMQPKKDRIAFAKMKNSIKVLLINEELEKEYILSTGFAMIETTINPRYVFQYFLSDRFNRQKDLLAEGTTQEAISNDDLERIFITYPIEFPEQQKIAEILETVDRAIEKTDKIIEKYKRIKQGLMQDLLTKGIDENGKIRSEKTHKFKDSPIGRIPEEWEVVKLLDVSNKIIDGTHYTPTYTEDGVPFLRVIDIQQQNIDLDSVMKIKYEEHKFLTKRCLPEYGDILYSKNGTIGISKLVDWKWEFSIFVSLCLIKPKHKKVFNIFLKYFLDSDWVKKQIILRAKQLSVTNLHLEEIREFIIFLPPLPEQQRIAEILSQIDNVIEKEQAYRQKLERIKKGLMEDLLTGKVRVNKLIKEEDKDVCQT
ncbi:restriction endonuclease subunit S [Sulfurihydrogenibium azorense]|uniref:restriction endonuclease subunit S n=1 Tax=Sulfurihydrogenibium azorense TaxID=309806 RepID=UPI00391A9A2B